MISLYDRARMRVTAFALLALIAAALPGCGPQGAAESVSSNTQPSAEKVLTISKYSKTVTYTLSQLKALPASSGWGAQYTQHGNNGPNQYKGVAVTELLKAVGGISSEYGVKVAAADSFTKTLSYSQVTQGDFTVYDAAGNPVSPETRPILIVVYEMNGVGLDNVSGPLMLGILASKSQLSGGSTWIKQLDRIDAIAVK